MLMDGGALSNFSFRAQRNDVKFDDVRTISGDYYSAFAPEAFTTFAHLVISDLM